MANVTMGVHELARTMVDVDGDADVELGNAAGATFTFAMPNDGKTILILHAVTGDTWGFTPTTCSHGRTETLNAVVAATKIALIGPFPPELWNNGDGQVIINPTADNVGDFLLAVKLP